MANPLVIGVDLDGTFAADVPVFRHIVQHLHIYGHQCVLVTNRGPEDRAVVDDVVKGIMPLVFAAGRPKRIAAREAGYNVDIWIDDNPILVDFGAEGLARVKEVR